MGRRREEKVERDEGGRGKEKVEKDEGEWRWGGREREIGRVKESVHIMFISPNRLAVIEHACTLLCIHADV